MLYKLELKNGEILNKELFIQGNGFYLVQFHDASTIYFYDVKIGAMAFVADSLFLSQDVLDGFNVKDNSNNISEDFVLKMLSIATKNDKYKEL